MVKPADKLGRNAVVGIKDAPAAAAHHMEVLVRLRVKAVGLTHEGQAEHLALAGHRAEVAIDRPQAYLGALLPNPLVDFSGGGMIHLYEDLTDNPLLHTVASRTHTPSFLSDNNNHYQ
jgi:hypothetical protein